MIKRNISQWAPPLWEKTIYQYNQFSGFWENITFLSDRLVPKRKLCTEFCCNPFRGLRETVINESVSLSLVSGFYIDLFNINLEITSIYIIKYLILSG